MRRGCGGDKGQLSSVLVTSINDLHPNSDRFPLLASLFYIDRIVKGNVWPNSVAIRW